MSAEFTQLETQPVIEVVSDDVVLPLIETSVISRTRDRYQQMESHQKRDFWFAVGSTIGGVALTTAAFIVESRRPDSKVPTILRTVGYSLDYADGYFAKRSASIASDGATTELGAIADPLADKFNNTLNELSLVKRDRLSKADLAIRAARDIGITAMRRVMTKRSAGRVDVKANKFGKFNTVVRDGVNLFASTETAENHPKINRALHTAANVYSVASALYTTHRLKEAYDAETASYVEQ